jgi:plasmid stability protein
MPRPVLDPVWGQAVLSDRSQRLGDLVANLKVRNLDDHVAAALKARAQQKGISLEEEVRRTLARSVARDRAELVQRAKALHAAAGGRPGKPELDSARIIREERDAWG